MKVYCLFHTEENSYPDLHNIFLNKEDADEQAKFLNKNPGWMGPEYFVQEWETN